MGADVHRVDRIVAQDPFGIGRCIRSLVFRAEGLGALFIRIAEGAHGDMFDVGEALGVDLSHASAADDRYVEMCRHHSS